MKLDCQRSTYEAVHQELESTRTQLMEKHAQELKHTEQTLTKKIHELSMLNEDLKVENDKLEVS